MGDTPETSEDQQTIDQQDVALKAKDQTISAQEAEIDKLNADLAEKDDLIADLRSKNARLIEIAGRGPAEDAAADKPLRTKPEVEVRGKKYRFRFAGFSFNGTHYEASDAALDEELVEKIVDTPGQTILKQIF